MDRERVATHWQALESEKSTSFFNSWNWISSWLDSLPTDLNIELIVLEDMDGPACCFFLGINKKIENKFYKKRGYLNSVGEYTFDDIVIEYNTILCRKDKNPQNMLNIAMSSLKDIEEFRLPLTINFDFSTSKDYFHRTQSFSSYWTNLNGIESDQDYLSQISKNKRAQIKRSIKEYEKQGPVQIEFAQSLEQAKEFFTKLELLHQNEWNRRGQPGAFSNTFFKSFHRNLIEQSFDDNKIQLIRVFTPKEDIGYLYYFIHNNEALFYQSGLNYKEDNKYRPGLVCHFLATKAFAAMKFNKYNFLAGGTQYKKSLSTNKDDLSSIILSRKTMKSRVENFLRTTRGI
jgi:CelD/BcsL family acetyltransferase involved in cellulose biosynthesis